MSERLIGLGALMTLVPHDLTDDLPVVSIRVGAAERVLRSADDFRVWGSLSREPNTLEELTRFVHPEPGYTGEQRLVGDDSVADIVERLRSDGAVVGIHDGQAQVDLAMRLRLLPLWQGSTQELADAGRFPIGTAHGTVSVLTAAEHAVWARLDGHNSIAEIAVGRSIRDGFDDAAASLPDAWQVCLELVRQGAAYFDLALT